MDYKITQDQLDMVVKPYFDKWFINSEYGTRRNEDGYRWTGFWVGNKTLLIGHPELDDSGVWFSNGQILDGWIYFDIEQKEFYHSMKRYLCKKFEVEVQEII